MKYLPYERITYESSLSSQEVLVKLAGNIREHRSSVGYNRPGGQRYWGDVVGDSFKIQRIIKYKNSFLPVMTGRVEPYGKYSKIVVEIRLDYFVLGFMMVWMLGAFFGLLVFGANFIEDGGPELLVPIVMLFLGYLLTTLAFKYESKKYRSFLEQLLVLKE